MSIYRALHIFFLVFHSFLILFNLFGWIWKPLRKLNLATLLLTGFSWFFLGIFYGPGYCPLTEWHYDVLNELGVTNLPSSYIGYLLNFFFHFSVSQEITDFWTIALYFTALICSLYFNFIIRIIQRKQ